MSVEPFEIAVSESTLDDLRDRLSRTRWPDQIPGVAWEYGTDRSYLEALVGYWRSDFDWRTREMELNHFDHFRADIDGFGIHYLYEHGIRVTTRSPSSSTGGLARSSRCSTSSRR